MSSMFLALKQVRYQWQRMMNTPRARQVIKTFNNLRITLICLFVTILVLRGTLGAGKFGTPEQDVKLIRREFIVYHEKRALAVEKERAALKAKHQEHERDPSVPYVFSPKVTGWDESREKYKAADPGCNVTSDGRPKIMMLTGSQPRTCSSNMGDHLLLKALKNKLDYARNQKIKIYYNMASIDRELDHFWAKLPLLRMLMLKHPEMEWFWWVDSDAFFTDMNFKIPLKKYTKYNMVLHGWDQQVYEEKNWVGINTGSFLIRNSQWAIDLFDLWAPMGPKGKTRDLAGDFLTKELKGRPRFEADDQSALVWLLAKHEKKLRPHVYLESSYYLHGFWGKLVDKLDEIATQNKPGLGDDSWPFVTHFVGCKPCASFGDYGVDRCLTQMYRTFHFGDNQVLKNYGYKHVNLTTYVIMPENGTSSDKTEL